ncbi:MAG: Lsr2 [Frankiales bacterium]|nr:Lsr2 [Frankiales bacterium]
MCTPTTTPAPARACARCGRLGARSSVRVQAGGHDVHVVLCEDHALGAYSALSPWISPSPSDRAAAAPAGLGLREGESRAQVRAWAQGQGLPVAARGSVSVGVLRAYRDAHDV